MLNSLAGRGVHVVTVNDYLARRDALWMKPIYDMLGVGIGILQNMQPYEEKRAAYAADVTYGTNSEFGFDYLRDNMATSLEEKVQHGGRPKPEDGSSPYHTFAIVDEVDNILIDEARTPLIISGAPEQAADLYVTFAQLAPKMMVGETPEGMLPQERRSSSPTSTTRSRRSTRPCRSPSRASPRPSGSSGSTTSTAPRTATSSTTCIQALKAQALYKRDVDYAVIDGEVKIIDEFTGRILEGRRWSEGLHQAVEAKEGVRVQEENQTLATITLQNYFRMYDKLAGMTGTALTEATEFMKIYELPVVQIPTNRADGPRGPQRSGLQDQGRQVVGGRRARSRRATTNGQPVLVGTISVEVSELLSERADAEGIKHTVLNAKPEHAEREGEIVAEAGAPGAVTIATNMAGRGVDIKLGGNAEHLAAAGAREARAAAGDARLRRALRARACPRSRRGRGGARAGPRGRRPVHPRHRAPRVAADRQPAARPRRPPGRPRRVALLPVCRGRPRAPVRRRPDLQDPRPARRARRGGQRGADRGRDALQADREGPAQGRGAALPAAQAHARVRRRPQPAARGDLHLSRRGARGPRHRRAAREEIVEPDRAHGRRVHAGDFVEDWDIPGLLPGSRRSSRRAIDRALDRSRPRRPRGARRCASRRRRWRSTTSARSELGEELMRALERFLLLQIIDQRWREHLHDMDYLREGIHRRGFAQIEPLVVYKNEAFDAVRGPDEHVWGDFARMIFHVQVDRRRTDDGAAAAARALARAGRELRDGRRPRPLLRRHRRLGLAGDRRRGCGRRPARAGGAGRAGRRPDGAGGGVARRRRAAPRRPRTSRAQRPVLVRVGQEVQEVPRRVVP